MSLRTVSAARNVSSRVAAQRLTPTIMSRRGYAPDSRQEGQTASSSGFKHREQAEEGAYAKRQEAAQLAKLREQLATSQKEKEELAKKVKDLESKSS